MRAALIAAALLLAACEQAAAPAVSPDPPAAIAAGGLPEFFDCLRARDAAIASAHRGASDDDEGENAIGVFEDTLAQGLALLEIDVRATRDGVLVLMHDETVDRMTDGRGPVGDLTLAQFQALTLDSGGHPPTLQAALEWSAGRAILELDIKREVRFEDVIAAVRAADGENRVVLIVASPAAALVAHGLAREFMLSVPIDDASDLERLERGRVDLSRVIAWTGIVAPDGELYALLAARGVEAKFGAIGAWDRREGGYREIAQAGARVVASDHPRAAQNALDAVDGVDGWAGAACLR